MKLLHFDSFDRCHFEKLKMIIFKGKYFTLSDFYPASNKDINIKFRRNNMKKIILAALALFLLIACVSASDLVSEDFENFTVDVPSDASFKEGYPVGTAFGGDSSGNLVPQDANPYWFDDNIDISIDYADMDYQKLMDKRFEGAKLSSEDGDIHVFDISDCKNSDDKQYAVCIADKDQSSVIICGNDLDELNEMAKTVKFK